MDDAQKITRASGDQTRRNIIAAAQKLFVKYGFSGTSISQIAENSAVNRSLIFHHFSNKAVLWQSVKLTLMQKDSWAEAIDDKAIDSIDALINVCVDVRFKLYDTSSDYIRLICWQVLDEDDFTLAHGQGHVLSRCKEAIDHLQKRGEIRQDLSNNVIMTILLGSIYSPFMLQKQITLSNKDKKDFVEAMRQIIKQVLQ